VNHAVRYLVNTTYHGDHTFGNASFPAEVTVLSSRINRDNMTDLAAEKARRADNMDGDVALLDAVTDWRRPDVVFESAAEIDLGGRVVQLLYFGPGNGPGDTIVYLPDAQVAWTGNYLSHAGIAPMLLQGGPAPYLASLRRMRAALPELGTIVPGHGPVGTATPRSTGSSAIWSSCCTTSPRRVRPAVPCSRRRKPAPHRSPTASTPEWSAPWPATSSLRTSLAIGSWSSCATCTASTCLPPTGPWSPPRTQPVGIP
jgi:glyoxylase-like metal-dependent hydrolase (beta-lactamase superfamily II)